MAEKNAIQKMRQDMLDVGKVDQNGHYVRDAAGNIAKDADGYPIGKAGIKPTADDLVPRTPAIVSTYNKDPYDPPIQGGLPVDQIRSGPILPGVDMTIPPAGGTPPVTSDPEPEEEEEEDPEA